MLPEALPLEPAQQQLPAWGFASAATPLWLKVGQALRPQIIFVYYNHHNETRPSFSPSLQLHTALAAQPGPGCVQGRLEAALHTLQLQPFA